MWRVDAESIKITTEYNKTNELSRKVSITDIFVTFQAEIYPLIQRI